MNFLIMYDLCSVQTVYRCHHFWLVTWYVTVHNTHDLARTSDEFSDNTYDLAMTSDEFPMPVQSLQSTDSS
jgi:hypothetical protein